jgi:hypothetical protein
MAAPNILIVHPSTAAPSHTAKRTRNCHRMRTTTRCLITSALMGYIMVAAAAAQTTPRPSGGLYTLQRIANIRRNVERYSWAKAQRDSAISRAGAWVRISDEELWSLVPCQTVPRCIDVTMTYTPDGQIRAGCLMCGDEVLKYGNHPYGPDVFGKPWKLTCPSCADVSQRDRHRRTTMAFRYATTNWSPSAQNWEHNSQGRMRYASPVV